MIKEQIIISSMLIAHKYAYINYRPMIRMVCEADLKPAFGLSSDTTNVLI